VELKLSPKNGDMIDVRNVSVNMMMFNKNKDMVPVKSILGNSRYVGYFGAHESILINGVLRQIDICWGLL